VALKAVRSANWTALFFGWMMATKSEDQRILRIREATRLCRVAIADCEALLRRTEAMLRRSRQDNDPRD